MFTGGAFTNRQILTTSRRTLGLPLFALLIACSRPTGFPAPSGSRDLMISFRTDRAQYAAARDRSRQRLQIIYTIENRTSDLLYLMPCNAHARVALQRVQGTGWVQDFDQTCQLSDGRPIRVRPRMTITDTVVFVPGGRAAMALELRDAAQYRLVTEAYRRYDDRLNRLFDPLGISDRVSNAFGVRLVLNE